MPALALMSALLVSSGDAPAAVPRPSTSAGPWVLTFSDEFDGRAVDRSKWAEGLGWGRSAAGTYGWCDPADNVVGGGVLLQRIERRPQGGKPFSVGCLHTRHRFSQQYGYWEARMSVAGCPGARGAFWAKPADESWPPELDVVEIHGDQPHIARLTVHWWEGGAHEHSQGRFTGPDFSGGFHVFGAQWTPHETIWYVDGVERRRTRSGAPFMNDNGPFYTILNIELYRPDSSCGKVAYTSRQFVDYVRIWARAGS